MSPTLRAIGIGGRCPKCGTGRLDTHYDDGDLRRLETSCVNCGWVDYGQPRQRGESQPMEASKQGNPKYQEWKPKTAEPKAEASAPSVGSPATRALDEYAVATRRYLELREQTAAAEARAASLRDQVTSARESMDAARAKLDEQVTTRRRRGMSTKADQPKVATPKPPSTKTPNLEPRACEQCGTSFTPRRPTSRYCSDSCRAAGLTALNRQRARQRAASNGRAETVELAEVAS